MIALSATRRISSFTKLAMWTLALLASLPMDASATEPPLTQPKIFEAYFCNACIPPRGQLRLELLWPGGPDLDIHVLRPDTRRIYYGARGEGADRQLGYLDCDMPPNRELPGCIGGMETFFVPLATETSTSGLPYRFSVHHYSGEEQWPVDWRVRVTVLENYEIECTGSFGAPPAATATNADTYLRSGDAAQRVRDWSPVFELRVPRPGLPMPDIQGCQPVTTTHPEDVP